MEFILAHKAEILGGLWGLSEILSLVPSIKANGIFQLIKQSVDKAMEKIKGE